MTQVTAPIMLDATGQRIADNLRIQNEYLKILTRKQIPELVSSWGDVQQIVENGYGDKFFDVGDQFIIDWSDGDTKYETPINIVHLGTAETPSGKTVPAMYLQWHYTTPFGIPYDNYEAFYYAEEELPVGTYNVTMGLNWGKIIKDKTYQFTLTKPVPAGGQLAGFLRAYDEDSIKWTVSSYTSAESESAIETVSVVEGSSGINLGTFTASGGDTLNSIYRTCYGYNNYEDSVYRQWLNSTGYNWWVKKNKFDRVPKENTTKPGFLTGFEPDFLNVIKPIKFKRLNNTVTDVDRGVSTELCDRFFLPSLEQMYIKPQVSGVEGEAWDYWKEIIGTPNPVPQYETGAYPKQYAINAKTSPQYVRLGSVSRGHGYGAWLVITTGSVHNYGAVDSCSTLPACVIY